MKSVSVSSGLYTSLQNNRAVRWYVMVLPVCHRGSAKGLQAELDRRRRSGEPVFEFFAPSYVEVKNVDGSLVNTERPLLYNYVFIHSSEHEIFRMKQQLPWYNFLPRVREEGRDYYPYLSDEAMKNLRWIARSYSDVLPVYLPEPGRLMKGDRVRITEGQFKGAEARVIIQPGAGQKDIMVCVENWMWIPLLRVRPGQYEVIALNDKGKHVYTRLDNERIQAGLHEALGRYYSREGVTEEDRKLATDVLQQYGKLQMDTDVMRCKHYALLLQAYTVLDNRQECEKLINTMRTLLPLIRAEQSQALLLAVLYGCTDNSIWYNQVHAIIDPWRKEKMPKKSKQRLIRQLEDYDKWLGH
ncbi:transcriptional regulator [Odoribacter lunatus]|uniref:transcriptional regulator n=1 Tax=Odoribacter lunatus TaxID=2941335 RepID=UPI00203CFC4E|nr:transcriptional regulator [Odoribacter lunatus]